MTNFENNTVFTSNDGRNITLKCKDTDKQIRLDVYAILHFIKNKSININYTEVLNRPKKWGYHRLSFDETTRFLRK